MKRKYLLLLGLALSQSASVLAMDCNEESFAHSRPAKQMKEKKGTDLSLLQQSIAAAKKAIDLNSEELLNGEKVILLGMTGSGKSTLTNFLMGNKLIIGEEGKLDTQNPLTGSAIGHEIESKTTQPYLSLGPKNMVLCDCPGFEDSRGSGQDIIHAYAIQRLFSGKCKILLAVPETELTGRMTDFLRHLNQLTQVVPVDQLMGSLALVITKQGMVRGVKPRDNIKKLINAEANKLTEDVKKVLNYLTNEEKIENRIPYFPYPKNDEGEYDAPEARENILEALGNLNSMSNPKVTPFISDESKLMIINCAQELNEKIADLIGIKGLQKTIKLCKNHIDGHVDSIKNLRIKLKDIARYLNNIKTHILNLPAVQSQELTTYLDKTLVSHEVDFFPTKKLRKLIEQISFLKSIENNVSYDVHTWAYNFDQLITTIQKLSKKPETTIDQDLLTLKGCLIGTSDMVKHLAGSNIKKVNVFGLNTLFMDQNITSLGTSLHFISPHWRVIGNKTIDLHGINGISGAHGINPGNDGRPGGPGNPAGNVFGQCVSYDGLNHLQINISGGNGGNGGNGHRGYTGSNGRDGNLGHVTRSEGYSRSDSWIENNFWGTYTWTHAVWGTKNYYEERGTDGTAGGNGGNGGHQGFGGHHGNIKTIGFSTSNLQQLIANNGSNGHNGAAGAGGSGGQHGRHCQGIKRTDLHESLTVDSRLYPIGYYDQGYYDRSTDDEVEECIQYQSDRGCAASGNAGVGVNGAGQQQPIAPLVLDAAAINSIVQPYKAYYSQSVVDPIISPFIKAFPNVD